MHFAFCIGIYLLTLTQVHTFDALSYILDVDRKPWRELFHPHHLAYGPLGALIRSIALGLGWQGSAALLIQATNALAGAAGVAIFFALMRATTGRSSLAAAGALLLGSSYAFWYYAVEVEVYTIAALFLIVALALIAALLRQPSLALAAALGCAQGLAVLFHQTNVLLSVPATVALVAGGRRQEAGGRRQEAGGRGQEAGGRKQGAGGRRQEAGGRREAGGRGQEAGGRGQPARYQLLVAYALPLGMIVGGAYLWVGLGVSGFRSWDALAAWMAGYTQTGWWGGTVDGAKLTGLGAGLSESLAQPGGTIIGGALLAMLLASLRGLQHAPRGLVWTLLAWLLTYGAFFLWWEPDNIEFWIASMPPFYLLLVLGLGGRRAAGGGRQWPVVVLLATGLAMFAINLGSIRQRGDARTDLQREIAEALETHSGPGDLLVVPDGLLELYLPYYAGRESVISLNQAMGASGGDWPGACDLLRGRVDLALASGYAALIADEALRPSPAPTGEPPSMMERFGLSPAQVASCYAPLTPMLTDLALGPNLPSYRRIASPQELADGAGWDFTRGGWGWRATNAGTASVTDAGLVLTPGEDPSLSSPPLQLDAARYGAIELRIAAETSARDAQLFFLDSGGQADEGRSLRWQLIPGPEAHTYHLDLSRVPDWDGQIYGLRLDPVGAGDGGEVRVEAIRLVR